VADAIEAVRSVSQLPIVALLTFDEGAETLAGVTAREAAERLAALDVAAIGANHGAGLLAALAALEQMHADGRVLAALPNIGLASLAGGRVIYPHATPEYFAEFAAHARDLGARVIGGCCGGATAGGPPGDRRGDGGGAKAALAARARRGGARRRARRGAARDRARARAPRGRVRALDPGRPAARRLERRPAPAVRRARGVRPR